MSGGLFSDKPTSSAVANSLLVFLKISKSLIIIDKLFNLSNSVSLTKQFNKQPSKSEKLINSESKTKSSASIIEIFSLKLGFTRFLIFLYGLF